MLNKKHEKELSKIIRKELKAWKQARKAALPYTKLAMKLHEQWVAFYDLYRTEEDYAKKKTSH